MRHQERGMRHNARSRHDVPDTVFPPFLSLPHRRHIDVLIDKKTATCIYEVASQSVSQLSKMMTGYWVGWRVDR